MKHSYLQNFRSLDTEAFQTLMKHLGFASAVCYRLNGEALVQVISTESSAGSDWPVAVNFNSNYTSAAAGMVPRGWVRTPDLPINRKAWPKAANLYFPEQEFLDTKLVFAVNNAAGKRSRIGEFHGGLEAIATRMRGWLDDQNARQSLSEAGVKEHIKTLGVDLTMLIDHELRTPLASVLGYASLLRDTDRSGHPEAWQEYWEVLEGETVNALDAVEKLSLALHSDNSVDADKGMESFDAAEEVREVCLNMQNNVVDIVGVEAAKKVRVTCQKATDFSCVIQANQRNFQWAVWEVLKNAVIHARGGRVDVAIYTSDRMLVVDISDDGPGVSPGSEELIFLRFYQDPGVYQQKRGKRGMGLGLFLARHIAERHLGQLTFIRHKGGSLFRFIWPFKVSELKGELKAELKGAS